MHVTSERFQAFEVPFVVFLGLAGFLGAIALVIEGNLAALALPLDDPVSASIHVWILLIGTQGAVWAVALAYMVKWDLALLRDGGPGAFDLAVRVGLPLVVVLGTVAVLHAITKGLWTPVEGEAPWPPKELRGLPIGNLPIFTVLGLLTAVVAVAGMFLAQWRAACDLDHRGRGIERYLALHRLLDIHLLLAALVLGMGVLATAALREAYNAIVQADAFARSYVIAYGGLYSVFLAISYGACRMQFHARGVRLRDTLAGPPPKAGSQIKEWRDTRAVLNDLLHLRLNGLSAFGETFSVAIPLLAGAISSALGSDGGG
jgi:hypothetical protein